jgi:hypothetical protein
MTKSKIALRMFKASGDEERIDELCSRIFK